MNNLIVFQDKSVTAYDEMRLDLTNLEIITNESRCAVFGCKIYYYCQRIKLLTC